VARYKTTTRQAFNYRVVLAVRKNLSFYDGVEPRRPNRRSAEHSQSRRFALPVMLLSAASTSPGQSGRHVKSGQYTRARICQ